MERFRIRSYILSTLAFGGCLLALTATGMASDAGAQTGPGATQVKPAKPAPPANPPAPHPTATPPAAPSPQELAGPPANATLLPSGLSTRLLRAGKGTLSPRPQDFVFFYAIGRRQDGAVVQNTFAAPAPTKLQLGKLIPAWQEGMGGMVPGEQRRFWFPAALAPKNPKTGVQEAVVFDIELVNVARMADPPKALKAPDPKAKQIGLGSWVLTTKPGKAGARATRQDAALLNFTVWNDLGQPLTTSVVEGRPTLFPLDRVMTSFADCVEGMQIGEVRYCWVSAEHNEGFPGAAHGALIFELELLNLADAAKVFTPGTAKPN